MDMIHALALSSGVLLYVTGLSLTKSDSDTKKDWGCFCCYIAGMLVGYAV